MINGWRWGGGRYVLLLKEIMKNSSPNCLKDVQEALNHTKKMASEINQRQRQAEHGTKLVQVSDR